MEKQHNYQYDVAVLLPTRGRTVALTRSVLSLFNRVRDVNRVQILLGFDEDDEVGIKHWQESLKPILDGRKIKYTAMIFEPMGYLRLNEYVSELARNSDAAWFMFWNDDAVMETQGWDSEVMKYDGEFKLLAVHTHRDHPYSIFPILPRKWYDLLGYISPHSVQDGWLSQQAYLLDIFERIPVDVLHDRADLTGNNLDSTYKERELLEGNPSNPGDFHHVTWHLRRMQDCDKLAEYLKGQGISTWWDDVKAGKIKDPWIKLQENDPNDQCKQFQIPVNQMVLK